jgi:hypothetical protein
VRFQRGENSAAVAFVRLVQVPDHDVGIADVCKAERLGLGERANGNARPLQVLTEPPRVLLLFVLVDALS